MANAVSRLVSLLDRLRPGVEAAPWVVAELDKLIPVVKMGGFLSDGWIDAKKELPVAGQLIVKRWRSGSVWAGVYRGTDKESSFDYWYALPMEVEQ